MQAAVVEQIRQVLTERGYEEDSHYIYTLFDELPDREQILAERDKRLREEAGPIVLAAFIKEMEGDNIKNDPSDNVDCWDWHGKDYVEALERVLEAIRTRNKEDV